MSGWCFASIFLAGAIGYLACALMVFSARNQDHDEHEEGV